MSRADRRAAAGEPADPAGPRRPARRRRWGLGALAAAVVIAGVGGGLIGAAIASPNSPKGNSGSQGASSGSQGAASGASAACPVTSVADKVLPSVVTISAAGASGSESGSGTGSGEVIRDDGYIVTNNHVIAGAVNGGSVHVLFSDGVTEPATIVGRDVLTDLAVLRVQPAHDLKAVALGSSESVDVGQPVIAIGAPLGLSGTVTSGIVSAVDRTVEVPAENDSSALLVSSVQTDAAINPGNSGGALVNCEGQLVGVPTAGATVPSSSGSSPGNIGLGFAIPVDVAKTISSDIIAHGRASHSYFGLQTLPVPEESAAQGHVSEGLFVNGVAADGPAEQAGLRQGDVITSVEGEHATSNMQLQKLTLTKNPGDKVALGYVRGGHSGTATVTLTQQP